MIKRCVEYQFNLYGMTYIYFSDKYTISCELDSIYTQYNPFYIEVKLKGIRIKIKKRSINLDKFISDYNGVKFNMFEDEIIKFNDVTILFPSYKRVLHQIHEYIISND